MTDREFRDNALIAVSASLAAVERTMGKGTVMFSTNEVANQSADIVNALLERRKSMEAKRETKI